MLNRMMGDKKKFGKVSFEIIGQERLYRYCTSLLNTFLKKTLEMVIHFLFLPWVDPEGGGGGRGPNPSPLKNHKNIGSPSNIGPDPLKIPKLPSKNSMLTIIGMPAKRSVSLAGR